MQTELRYGFLIGILMIGGIYAEYYIGFHNASLLGGTPPLSGILFLIIGVVLGTREKKRSIENGLTYKQAFLCGLTIAFISGLILACYAYLYVSNIDPNYAKQAPYELGKKLKDMGMSDDYVKLRVLSYQSILTPASQFMSASGITILIGVLVSGIASFFFKSKNPKSTKADLLA